MLKFESLTLRRGPEPLLDAASALVHTGQRVAVIGANGAGKTSLFKLILGDLQVDAGDWSLAGNCRVAHMAQEVVASERSALDYVLDGHAPLRTLQVQLAEAEQNGDDARLAHVHGELEAIRAYEAPAQAEKLLHGLGFAQHDMQSPVSAFSGGWRIRLNLAQALMSPSDLLLLDEPTNHLDLDAMYWLEQWLKRYAGTVLFISHDRDFIDAVATHILHIEHKKLHQYAGGYSQFERQRAEKLAQQQAMFEKQQQRVEEIHRFVARFKAKASKAKQAQSRLKELDRMEAIAPAHIDSPFSFSFPFADKMSSPLLNLQAASLGYAQQTVLGGVSLSLLPGTRIGLLGPNGAGKSTLVKTLVGDLPLIAGSRTTGEHAYIGYFAQHQLEALDLHASPFVHLQRAAPKASDQEIRNFLGGFDFRGDQALEGISRFSGGEKARLALALIAWQQPNLLILDEPTNHLDLEMRHALTVALQAFEGAVVLVSHDRHLLKNTVDEFLLVADGKVAPFKGDLQDYHTWLVDYQRRQGAAAPVEVLDTTQGESAQDRKERKRLEAQRRQQLAPLKKELQQVEQRTAEIETQLQALEERLADSGLYATEKKAELATLLDEQAQAKQALAACEERWFELSESLEAMESVRD